MGFDLLGTVESDIGSVIGGARNVVGGAVGWVEQQWTQRIVQISVYAAILFFVLSSYDLIDTVDKTLTNTLGVKVGKEGTRALHAVTFGFFMYIGVRFILDPLVKRFLNGQVVEGQAVGQPCGPNGSCDSGASCVSGTCKDPAADAAAAAAAATPPAAGGGAGSNLTADDADDEGPALVTFDDHVHSMGGGLTGGPVSAE